MPSAFDIYGKQGAGPVCISVPHAGRSYPGNIAAELAMPLARARGIEDRHADLLAEQAIARGHCTLIARTPRLLIDLNRAETDFDPASVKGGVLGGARPSFRARGGLGLVPDRLPGAGPLWRSRPDLPVLAERIATVHRPYHAAVAEMLGAARRRHGYAVLVDLHSMPPLPRGTADIVIGDLHGRSASAVMVDAAQACFERHGLRVAYNLPYAGGYILERHARPQSQVHALQIEVDRRLYLDTRLDTPGPGLNHIEEVIADLADVLAALDPGQEMPLAAE